MNLKKESTKLKFGDVMIYENEKVVFLRLNAMEKREAIVVRCNDAKRLFAPVKYLHRFHESDELPLKDFEPDETKTRKYNITDFAEGYIGVKEGIFSDKGIDAIKDAALYFVPNPTFAEMLRVLQCIKVDIEAESVRAISDDERFWSIRDARKAIIEAIRKVEKLL